MKNSGFTINRPLGFFAFVVVAVAVFLLAIAGFPFFYPSSNGAPPKPLRTIPHTDVNPFGANFFLQWEAEDWKVEKTVEMAHEAGLGWLKQHFPWEDIELKKGVFWDDRLNKSTWAKYDRIVDLAEKNRLKIIARLDRPPDWTRQNNSRKEAPPDNFQDYADFVEAVVKRYRGRIQYYQLWNEPNIWPEWGDQPVDPAAYATLLRLGYEATKRADPDVFVLSAPLAQTLESSDRAMSDLEYLQRIYDSGAKDYFDILFANAYGFSLPPDDPPDPTVLNFRRAELLRDIMVRNGDDQKAVWFNEFGWTAPPAGFPMETLTWGSVTEQQQAEHTVAAIEKARAEWPWAGVFCIWYFRQDGHIPSDRADYYFRMVDVGFTPRPLYHAVKAKATMTRVAPAGDYQETGAAVIADGAWQLKKNRQASGFSYLASSKPGDNLTITFRGTDVSLLVKKGPEGGFLNVSLDGAEVGGLPGDRQGRSYVDLYSPNEQWQATIPIAEGLPNGEHRLRIVVSGNRNPDARDNVIAIDGFAVREIPSWPWIGLASAAVAIIAGLSLIAVSWRNRRARTSA